MANLADVVIYIRSSTVVFMKSVLGKLKLLSNGKTLMTYFQRKTWNIKWLYRSATLNLLIMMKLLIFQVNVH